jgi:D-cysteine desulfhydrase/L-cysteate sulfo-lyase
MTTGSDLPTELGSFADKPRASLVSSRTPLEPMPNLTAACGGARLFVKRDDCTGLAFGGNKVRQLEFYLGEALVQGADTVLITSAVQSNFVRTAAAAACKLGMDCHVQLEERVPSDDPLYRRSGNVFLDKLLGATLYSYPEGEDEAGADQRVRKIAAGLAEGGRKPYVIPLAPGHPPLGALGYVVAAKELLNQLAERNLGIDEIFVASGSGATHGGLLFGLRALGSKIPVTGVCVRRAARQQVERIRMTCDGIASLLGTGPVVGDDDIRLTDAFLAPGYGRLNAATSEAILLGARREGLILDPVYSGKAMAGCIDRARAAPDDAAFLFVHTGGTPAIFAYQSVIERVLGDQVPENSSV